jgi:pSer/pThr/pTyr-binding forkhead associated (FHA) protein
MGEPAIAAPIRFDPPKIEAVPPRNESLPLRPFAKPDPTRETAVLSDNNPILRRMIRQNSPSGTASLGEGREIILVIRGMVERIIITEGKKYKLGRFEVSSRSPEEIDLSPYGALDRGVSRVHAELSLKGEHIYITDLTSTNGTYLAGTRLKPNEATLLRKGDELLIGRLPVQVLFR